MTITTAEKLVAVGIAPEAANVLTAEVMTVTNQINTTTTLGSSDIVAPSQKAVKTYVDGARTQTGVVTFSAMPLIPVNADVAAAGSTVTDAAQLSAGFTVVTGANGTLGVKLPATPAAGTIVIIKGTTSGVLKVWPDAAATINAVGSNGAMSLASGVIPAIFIAKSATQWYTIPLLPS